MVPILDPRSILLICPGYIAVPLNATANVIVNLPSWVCLVETIEIEVTDNDMNINIRRSDEGALSVTQGAVRCALLGAIEAGVAAGKQTTISPGNFVCDKNSTITFECTDLSGVENEVYVAIYTRWLANTMDALKGK